MFVNLVVVACSLAFASAAYNGPLAGGQPADLYPAGVDPKACPNFPDCSNPAVAVNQIPQNQYQPQYQAQPQPYQSVPQYQSQPQYQPQTQYSQSINQYNPAYSQQYAPSQPAQQQYSPEVQNALDRGEYIGDGDYHGEGLAEALAPGYAGRQQQQAYNAPPAYNQAPAAQYQPAPTHAQPAQIPAGVDARACPNYPYCH